MQLRLPPAMHSGIGNLLAKKSKILPARRRRSRGPCRGYFLTLIGEQLEPRDLLSTSPLYHDASSQFVSTSALVSRELPDAYHTHHYRFQPDGSGATPLGTAGPTGTTPTKIRHAYGFDQISFGGTAGDGTGTTIAIVDAFDNPNIASDLIKFDAQFGLPDPVFTKVNQTGGSVMPPVDLGWASEIALDVQWAHAIAPKANILLVEATDNSFTNLNAAVTYAAQQTGVVVVSMSYGGGEFSGELGFDNVFQTPAGHTGVTFIASSGDNGAPPSQPAISPNVLAVGGTTLNLDSSGNIVSETGWSGSGGGISLYEPQPSYQTGVVTQSTTLRTNPDVAYDSDPSTGFPVYDTVNNSPSTPWSQFGGTSDAAPQWAALIAIADQGRALSGLPPLDGRSQVLSKLYAVPATDFRDIISGSSLGSPIYTATAGYDLVTGRGSPLANKVISDLIGFGISGSVPAVGSTVATPPASYVLSFSTAADAASVQAADFSVNGITATSVVLNGAGTSATFTFASNPVTSQGLQTMHVAAGAITLSGNPIPDFTGTFRYDALAMQVVSTVPIVGSTITLAGSLTYDLNFNESFDPTSVQSTDLTLSGLSGVSVSPSVVFLNGNTTARFTINGLTTEGTLSTAIAAGTITDVFGNSNTTAFSATYTTDIGTIPFPTPLVAEPPLGSLIYDGAATGTIAPVADTDSFTLAVDAGQTIALLVTPPSGGLIPKVDLFNPSNTLIGTASAGQIGATAILQTTPAISAGVYKITISGIGGTSGPYSVKLTLNAAQEIESQSGATNDTLATAQNIDGSVVALATGTSRLAVSGSLGSTPIGSIDFETGVIPNSITTYSSSSFGRIQVMAPSIAGNSSKYALWMDSNSDTNYVLNEAVYTVNLAGLSGALLRFSHVNSTDESDTLPASFTGHFNGDGVAISSDGTHWYTILNAVDDSSWTTTTVDLAAAAASAGITLGANFQIKFQQYDNYGYPTDGRAYDDIQISLPDPRDEYQLTLASGVAASIALKALGNGTVNLLLRDGSGAALASAVAGATNFDQLLTDFKPTLTGPYYLEVTGDAGTSYNLLVTKNAEIDSEPNETFAAAQNVSGAHGALGYVGGAAERLFSVPTTSFNVISELDPTTGVKIHDIPSPESTSGGPDGLAFDGTYLYYINGFGSHKLWKLNPDTGAVIDSHLITAGSGSYDGVAALNGKIYITDYVNYDIIEYDPTTNTVTKILDINGQNPGITVVGGLSGITGPGALVATVNAGSSVVEIDPATGLVTHSFTPLSGIYYGVAVVNGQIFLGNGQTNSIDVYSRGGTLQRSITTAAPSSALGGDDMGSSSEDWYALNVINAGSSIQFVTSTPASASGEFVNNLNPHIELYSPANVLVSSGTTLSDGLNESIQFIPATTGLYRLRVTGESSSSGEYFLSITGNTVNFPPFQVTSTTPADGAKLVTAPTTFSVDFNDVYLATSIQANDLRIDGSPIATSFVLVDGDTVTFSLPAIASGAHTVTIASGAIQDIQGTPLTAYSGTFTFDNIAPRVTAITPSPGAVVAPGVVNYQVTFSEPMLVANLSVDDFTLFGTFQNTSYSPTNYSFNSAGTILTLQYPALPEDNYTLTLYSGFTGGDNFTDLVGNELDGEFTGQFPSGDGANGGDFVANVVVDATSTPFPTPLVAENPAGSLIYDGSTTGAINTATDVDTFTLAVDSGQTITVLVSPAATTLKPSITLRNPAGAVIGSVPAPAVNDNALLETITATSGGIYSIDVGSASTLGMYTLTVTLNAALEKEGRQLNASNNSRPTAQDLNASFLPLSFGAARGAVLGANPASLVPMTTFNFESGAQGYTINNNIYGTGTNAGLWHLSQRRSTETGHSPVTSFYYGSDATGTYDTGAKNTGTITSPSIVLPAAGPISLSFNYVLQTEGAFSSFDLAAVQVSTNGTTYTTIATSAQSSQLPQSSTWRAASVDLSSYVGQSITLRFSFDTVDDILNDYEGWYVDDVQILTPVPWTDYYSFTASANDTVFVGLKNLTGSGTSLSVENAAGLVLAAATTGATNFDKSISNLVLTAPGTYYLRVDGTPAATYSLIVAKNAAFDTEANDSFATAQDLHGLRSVLGQGGIKNLLYGSTSGGQLFTVNLSTGAGTLVGDLPILPTEIEFNNLTRQAFVQATDGSFFGSAFDINTAAGIGSTVTDNASFHGLEWVGSTLYGTATTTTGGTSTLRTLSPTSGTSATIGSTGLGQIVGLAYDTATSTMYGITGGASTATLVKLNLATGAPTTVGATGFLAGSLEFGPDGLLYSGGAGADQGKIFRVDKLTGASTLVGVTGIGATGLKDVTGLALVLNGNDDWYMINVTSTANAIAFVTGTPGDGAGEFVNTLQPHIELYSPSNVLVASGTLLPDGRNEAIEYTPLVTGNYRVRVTSSASVGEYLLASNHAPAANNNGVSTAEGAAVPVALSGSDPDNDPLTYSVVNGPLHGSLTGTVPNLTYTPAGDYNGSDTFTFKTRDGLSDSKLATVTISISEVNDPPAGQNDPLSSMAEDSGDRLISFTGLLSNDSKGPANESNQTLSLVAVGNATGGTVTMDASNVIFSPTHDYNGPASFVYTFTDDGTTNGNADPLTSTGTVTFNITEVNDAPTGNDDPIASIAEDSGDRLIAIADLISNDSTGPANESNQTLTITAVASPVGGTVAVIGNNVVFSPTHDFNGPASFVYTLRDNGATGGSADPLTSTAMVTFNITDVNDPPVGAADPLASVAEDSGDRLIAIADLLSNDSSGPADESNQTIALLSVGSALGGAVSINGSNIVFVASHNYNGLARFVYTLGDNGTSNGNPDPLTSTATVTFTITEVNDPPTGTNDSLSGIAEDAADRLIPIANLLSNDLRGPGSENGQTLSMTAVDSAVGGTVVINGNNVVFSPTHDFNGPARFVYTLTDNGTTAGIPDPLTSTATVTFNITEVNDAPTGADDFPSNIAEDSGPSTMSIASLLSNDAPGPANESNQNLTLTLVNNPIGGTVAINGANVVFTPTHDYNGLASFVYTLRDDGKTNGSAAPLTGTATVNINVTEVNDPPFPATDQLASIAEDSGPLQISSDALLQNDSPGPANESTQSLTVIDVFSVVGGTAEINGSQLTFHPAQDFNGDASFVYRVTDDGQTDGQTTPLTNTATVTFTITPVNDEPSGQDDNLPSIAEDSGPETIAFDTLTTNDSSGPANEIGQLLTVIDVGSSIGGSVSTDGTNVIFTPDKDFNGAASFSYTLQDNGVTAGASDFLSSTAVVHFNITPVNDPPSFDNIGPQSSFDENDATHGPALQQKIDNWATNLLAGPPDESGQQFSFHVDSDNHLLFAVQPAIDEHGTLTYTPMPNAHGKATVTVTLQDSGEGDNTSRAEQFTIEIVKRHKLHNASEAGSRNGRDVTGSTTLQPDGFIVAGDVLAVINYINAKGSGPIPAAMPVGAPFCDVDGDDEVVAQDVVSIINYINAHPGQAEAEASSIAASSLPISDPSADLISLLAADVATQALKRRRASI